MRSRIAIERITGLVLAGGRGSRMDSVDKGLQPFRGRPLVAHVLARLAPQVGPIVISANRNGAAYAAFGHPVLPDRSFADAGPLAGLHAGLAACRTDLLAIVPCDAPLFPADLVARLSDALDDDVDVVTACTPQRKHPVFCLMRTTVADGLEAFVAEGGRSVGAWLARTRAREVSFDDERAFRNLNTFDELHAAERDA